ncbi:MAG: hypothetical protein GX774_02505 [Armatimonadetes bacterium]|nr:hypothetical protein [Armatimonadota bacterium]
MRAAGSKARRLKGLWAGCLLAALAGIGPARGSESAPGLRRQVPVRVETLEIEAGKAWATRVAVPRLAADEAPVLSLRARVQTPSLGGCNYVLQVLVEGVPLTESPMRPRLLNKAPWFDPPGTSYHFSWYSPEEQGWMTVFSPSWEGNWGGSGRDFEYLFDLTGLVTTGETVRLGFRYLNPGIPAALGVARAPLTLEGAVIGVMARAEVERLRGEVQQGYRLRSVPVDPNLPVGATPGERPYEIVWSGRKEPPGTQVAFDDLTGWTLHALGDAAVSLSASVDHRLWRPKLAKFSYGGGTTDTAVEIRPPEPILIPGRFDAANLWLYGGWDRVGDRPLRIFAALEDQAGREFVIDLGEVTASYWGLQHGVLSPRLAAKAQFPLRFTALRITNCRAKGERHAYLESLRFYQRNRRPFAAPPRPRPAPFPTSDDGMLPTPPAGVRTRAERWGQGARFTAQVGRDRLEYRVRPEEGCLHGVTARWNEGPRFRPMADGGLTLEGSGTTPAAGGTIVSSTLRGGCLTVRWRGKERVVWEADYQLRGRTLVVEVRCPGGAATGLALGQVAGLPEPRGIEVPYLLMGQKPGPWIACAGGLFVSVLPDWYHSDFSLVDTAVTPPRGDRIGLVRGTSYRALTNGRRNPLRDRVLVTVSPEFHETLPNARNPVSPNRQRLAPYLFFMADQLNPNLYQVLKRYGVDHLIASDFACLFVANHYAQGFAARWRPHPSLSVAQVQGYRRGIKALGFLFRTYLDATDLFPGNEYWDENRIALRPDGDLLDGWWGNYVVKPAAMPELVRAVGRKTKALYPPDCVYLDVHTNRGPEALDFEAGTPGAGMARPQVIANGDCILEARRHYGATISEGLYRWLYAGLCDMDYATLITTGTAADLPPLVDFDLLKIHPFQHGTMMGHHPDRFLGSVDQAALYQDPGRGPAPESFYKYVAASLAYGHMAMLGYWYTPPLARFLHYYALMQGVQSEYLVDTAREIRYHNGRAFLSTSRALADDSLRLGRVYVRYTQGLGVWVNYNAERPWRIRKGGRVYELPPYGWLIEKPGSILAYSARREGARVDFVRCPEYSYLNTGGVRAAEGPLEVEGAAWLKREGEAWRLIPCGDLGTWERFPPPGLPANFQDFRLAGVPADRGCRHLVLDTQALLGKPAAQLRVVGRTESGAARPIRTRLLDDGRLQIIPGEDVVDYLIR